MRTFKILSTFSHMPIEIPQRHDDFTRISQVQLTGPLIVKTNFLCVWFFVLCPYAHIICITSPPKASAIAITLSLCLLTSTAFPDIFFFTKIPTPPVPASFPDHHSLYLGHKVPRKRAPWPFYLTSCVQHTSPLP